MAWKTMKKEEPSLVPTMTEVKTHINDNFDDLESQEFALQEQLKRINEKKVQEIKRKEEPKIVEEQGPSVNKEELDDMIQGHLVRLSQLIEIRRSF
jgi:predicted FMN-binding regulatory protein PaiB